MGRGRTEGERRAAEEFADAVRPETVRFYGAVLDAVFNEVRRNPEILRPEPLTEEEADALALSAVHRAREEDPREAEDHPPGEAEVRTWVERRERDRMEGKKTRAWRPTPPR
jgi:hypothetical protein